MHNDITSDISAQPADPTSDSNSTSVPNAKNLESSGEEPPTGPGFTVKDRRFWAINKDDVSGGEGEARQKMPTFIEQLQQQLSEKDQQLRDYIAAYKKEVVEGLEKTKERLERDAATRLEQLRGQVAAPMVEVLDALERCVAATESAPDGHSLLQGVKMVHLLMLQKLQELGLERIAAVGRPFDPAFHEAVAVTPVFNPIQDKIIMAEFRPGFMLANRVIRPAHVQVGKLQQ